MKTTEGQTVGKLNHEVFATMIHGITGRDVEEGMLPAGTEIRNVRYSYDGEARFEARHGEDWYNYRAFGLLDGRPCDTVADAHNDGEDKTGRAWYVLGIYEGLLTARWLVEYGSPEYRTIDAWAQDAGKAWEHAMKGLDN